MEIRNISQKYAALNQIRGKQTLNIKQKVSPSGRRTTLKQASKSVA